MHPTTIETSSPALILPVSEGALSALIDAQATGQSTLSLLQQCSSLELAGLCVMNSAVKMIGTVDQSPEKKLAALNATKLERALGVLADDIQQQGEKVTRAIIQSLRGVDWQVLMSSLKPLNIALMPQSEMNVSAMLNVEGGWDSGAKRQKEYRDQAPAFRQDTLPYAFNIVGLKQHNEQDVLLQELERNPNESMILQGFAGCGKTTLVIRLSRLLNHSSTLYLSKSLSQIKLISSRLGKAVNAWDFAQLMRNILFFNWSGKNYWGNRFQLRALSYSQVAKLLMIETMNGYSVETVATIVDAIVINYCESADTVIGTKHCPPQLDGLSPDRYMDLAKIYWELIREMNPDSSVPLLAPHIMKLVDDNNIDIPVRFKNIIVDESHDLPDSLANILRRSFQSVIYLGDQYQVTNGKIPLQREKTPVRERHLFQSMRAGNNVNSIFKRVLEQHKILEAPGVFLGDDSKETTVSSYSAFTPPEFACAILSREYWFSFLAIIQLAEAGRPFVVFPGTLSVLRSLIPQSLSYLHGYPERRSHPQLMGHKSWSELVQAEGQQNGLKEVDRFFRTGFTAQQFRELLSRQPAATKECYYVGLVADAKSTEMSQVMLAPDVFDPAILDINEQRTRMLNIIYTGMSRALDGILLPGKESEWLLEG